MKECPTEIVLQSWLDGELAGQEAQALAAHVPGCTRCTEYCEGMRNVQDFLAGLASSEQARERVLARLTRRAGWWLAPVRFPRAVAAAVVLALAISLFFNIRLAGRAHREAATALPAQTGGQAQLQPAPVEAQPPEFFIAESGFRIKAVPSIYAGRKLED